MLSEKTKLQISKLRPNQVWIKTWTSNIAGCEITYFLWKTGRTIQDREWLSLVIECELALTPEQYSQYKNLLNNNISSSVEERSTALFKILNLL